MKHVTIEKEKLELVLEALESERMYFWNSPEKIGKAIAALREALAGRPAQQEPDDSLLLCASDLEHSAIYDNHSEMQSCIRAVALRIKALKATPQPEHEPVARVGFLPKVGGGKYFEKLVAWKYLPVGALLYTNQPQRKPLTDDECDKLAAQTMDKVAEGFGLHALEINPNILEHHTLRRALIRAAHGIGGEG